MSPEDQDTNVQHKGPLHRTEAAFGVIICERTTPHNMNIHMKVGAKFLSKHAKVIFLAVATISSFHKLLQMLTV